jgi:hypothetical protein
MNSQHRFACESRDLRADNERTKSSLNQVSPLIKVHFRMALKRRCCVLWQKPSKYGLNVYGQDDEEKLRRLTDDFMASGSPEEQKRIGHIVTLHSK